MSDIEEGSASNKRLRIEESDKLINYSTVIAYRISPGEILINDDYYSRTTSKHQNRLKDYAGRLGIVVDEELMNEAINHEEVALLLTELHKNLEWKEYTDKLTKENIVITVYYGDSACNCSYVNLGLDEWKEFFVNCDEKEMNNPTQIVQEFNKEEYHIA